MIPCCSNQLVMRVIKIPMYKISMVVCERPASVMCPIDMSLQACNSCTVDTSTTTYRTSNQTLGKQSQQAFSVFFFPLCNCPKGVCVCVCVYKHRHTTVLVMCDVKITISTILMDSSDQRRKQPNSETKVTWQHL